MLPTMAPMWWPWRLAHGSARIARFTLGARAYLPIIFCAAAQVVLAEAQHHLAAVSHYHWQGGAPR